MVSTNGSCHLCMIVMLPVEKSAHLTLINTNTCNQAMLQQERNCQLNLNSFDIITIREDKSSMGCTL